MTGTKAKPAKPHAGRPVARRSKVEVLRSPSYRRARKRAAERRRRQAEETKRRATGEDDG